VNDQDQSPPSEAVADPSEPTSRGAEPNGSKPLLTIPPILLEGDETAVPVIAGADHKYVLGPSAAAPESEENELPESYGTGRLLLAARDPHCLYAHWDLSPNQLKAHAALARDESFALRIHEDGLAGRQVLELPIPTGSPHAFAHVAQAGADYAADFGYYERGGEWKSLSASEPVRTPVESVSEEDHVHFATIPGEAVALPASVEEPTIETATVHAPQQGPTAAPPAPLPVRAELPPKLTQEFQGTEPGFQFPQTDAGVEAESGEESRTARQTAAPAGAQLALPLTSAAPGKWTPAHEKALAELIGWTVTRREWPGSAEIVELIGRQPELLAAEAAELGLGAVPVNISSPAGGELPQEQAFWFNVNAELVIYGATEPNAQVTIAGRAIQLRPDGSFSLRFALPDGNYSLPIQATSVTGEVRAAELEFYRGTRYCGAGVQPQEPGLKAPEAENVA
jgi:hypothetical protein